MNQNLFLAQRLAAAADPLSCSFSNRYTRWRHRHEIHQAFKAALKKRNTCGRGIEVLEIGCNEGYLVFELKQLFSKDVYLNFTGIDLNPEYIDFANARRNFFKEEHCMFMLMDAAELRFQDEQFDIIICGSMIEHLENPESALKEIKRVLKPNGVAIITTPNGNGGLFNALCTAATSLFIFPKNNNVSPRELITAPSGAHTGCGHISIKKHTEWVASFKRIGFTLSAVKGTSGLLYGSPTLDNHIIVFGVSVILDSLIAHLPFFFLWSIDLLYVLEPVELSTGNSN